jgi:hypothetical protein
VIDAAEDEGADGQDGGHDSARRGGASAKLLPQQRGFVRARCACRDCATPFITMYVQYNCSGATAIAMR